MKKLTFIVLLVGISVFTFAQIDENVRNTDTVIQKKTVMEKVVSWYMDNMNYGTIMLLMTVESSCFVPFPSEVVVPPAAYKASQEDSGLNIYLVVLFATIGALLGALINYFLAFWVGRPIVYRFADSKMGRMCLLNREKIQKAENYFVKYGSSTTFICRLIPGIRQVISVPAGLAKMKLLPFIFFTTLGAGIWNVILAVLGYLAHGQSSLINQYSKEISYIMLALGIVFAGYLVYNVFFKKKKAKK
jgi:membrane protein DedA with SNARE-associated domain